MLLNHKPISLLSSLILIGLLISCTGNKTDLVKLSSLDLSGTRQGWGKPQIDKSVTGKEMLIAGKKYEYGVMCK